MPIRPENRKRYPADWPAIRAAILERARNRCECDGRCGSWRCPAYYGSTVGAYPHGTLCGAVNYEPRPSTGSKVVLTVAHLDHTPEHNDPTNLRAYCQVCHLAYDAEHHAATRAATRAREATA